MTRRMLLAFDIDGVLNTFSKNGRGIERVEINGFPVGWRPQIIERVKALLALPGVEGAWLTTWLSEPSMIDELRPDRFGWLDDDLGRARGVPGDGYRPAETNDRLLLRTHEVAGLLEADMDRIEAWVSKAGGK